MDRVQGNPLPELADPEWERHKVVIAAAVAAAAGAGAEITGIRPLDPAASAWSRHGRVTIHSSHNVRGRSGLGITERGGGRD